MNINIDVKDPTHGYQHCNTFQILIYDGYVKVRESWYTQVIIWVNTILHHSDTRVTLPRLGGSLDGIKTPNGIENKNTVKYPYFTGIKKSEILILDTRMVS